MDAAVMDADSRHKTIMTPESPLIMQQGTPKIVTKDVTVHYGEKQAIFPLFNVSGWNVMIPSKERSGY